MIHHRFKIIGYIMIFINVVPHVILNIGDFDKSSSLSFILQLFSLIGFILIIMSKEKVDDERLEKLRLIAFRDTFVVLLLLSIVSIVLAYFGIFNEKSPISLILNIVFLFYLARYYLLKVK